MNRPRKRDRNLPACVYLRHGAFWYVKRGKWTRLAAADDLAGALAAYARFEARKRDGMAALIDATLPHLVAGRSAATTKLYTIAAMKLSHMLADFGPADVTPADVQDLMDLLRDTPYMANKCRAILSMVMQRAVKAGTIPANPVREIERHRTSKRTRRITLDELAAILAHASPRLSVVVRLCSITGQRIGDVLALRRDALREEGIEFQQGKTGARLTVAWTDELRRAVDDAKALHGRVASLYVVPGTGYRPLAHQPIWRDWHAACADAGVADARLHDLRALAGSEAKRQGLNAQALLGHTTEQMTLTYLRDRHSPIVQPPSIGQCPIQDVANGVDRTG